MHFLSPIGQKLNITFDDVEETGEAKIFGLTFSAPESFFNPLLMYWKDDPEFQDIQGRFKQIVSYNSLANIEFEGRTMKSTFDALMYSFDNDLVVIGGTRGYSIRLRYSLKKEKKDLLKAICYKISSTPETLYNVIVYDYAKEAFLPDYDYKYYGDFKISAYVVSDSVTYYVAPAK